MTFVQNISTLNFNPINVRFKSNQTSTPDYVFTRKDSFNSNPLYDNFKDKTAIEQLARSNPTIMSILKENKIPLKVNIEELENLKRGHLLDTRVITAKIYSALPKEMKSEVNLVDLQQAAMLHDYGKILIPSKILNKNDKLTESEQEIMHLHSILGYELLKQQGVNKNVLNLVKYHHQNPNRNGYPEIIGDYKPDIALQILSTADKYSALREERSYKNTMSREEALDKIRLDVDKGYISQEIYDALVKISS